MGTLTIHGRAYEVDVTGFLQDSRGWDEAFAEESAPEMGIGEGLTDRHWRVLRFIRESSERTGRCPLVYEACKANGLSLGDLHDLFPSGYLRGACKLAGLTYKEGYVGGTQGQGAPARPEPCLEEKVYRVNVRGFLVDPAEWDEAFAARMAQDMKMECGLLARHWEVLRYLRERFQQTGVVPTIFETSEAMGFDLDELETLFPDGYHRGAVKIAGLMAR